VPPLTVRADTAGITVGDPVVVHILAHLPPGAQLLDSIPRMRDTLPDGVRLLSAAPFRHTADGYSGEMRFAIFHPVATHLPSLAVLYRTDGAVDTLASAPIAVTVVPVVPEDNGTLQDIKGLDATPLGAVFIAAGSACLIGFVLLLRVFLRRRRARAYVPPVIVVLPAAYERAVAALDAVVVAGVSGDAEMALLYACVADVVRQYIAAALALPALERTTPEILRSLPPAHLRNGTRDALRAFLTDADLVKFARERPAPDAATAFVRRARSIVDALRDATLPAA
jgi:hypothetical protein